MTHFKKFKEELPNKGKFYSSLIDKKKMTKEKIMFLRFGTNLKLKR